MYQPKTGSACTCKRGVQRDNCPQCEGTGQVIDFRAIHARREAAQIKPGTRCECLDGACHEPTDEYAEHKPLGDRCSADAVRMVTVPIQVLLVGPPCNVSNNVPMCAACADYAEAKAGAR